MARPLAPRVPLRARGALAAAALLAGCHSLQPVEVERLSPGNDVRVRVAGSYADSLDTVLFRDARVFEARVVENRGGALLLEIPVQEEFTGMELRSMAQRVELPRDAFLEVELKRLDRGRTLAAAAAAGAVVAAVAVAQLSGESGGDTGPGVPGPQDARLPRFLLRIPVP